MVPKEVIEIFRRQEIEERKRRVLFGEVRPVISTEYEGHRLVGVGNRIYWSKRWKTFHDFLLAYLQSVFGSQWWTAESAAASRGQHAVMEWYKAYCDIGRAARRNQDGFLEADLDGPSAAFLLLAYDLYLLRDHGQLQDRLLHRLRLRSQFQGARYEVFVAATCIRAGFTVRFEDESDASRRHPEFLATHTRTGQIVAVEAKSRHRPGVLGRPGPRRPEDGCRADIGQLLNQALQKSVSCPYVIFIDLNLPPIGNDRLDQPWLKRTIRTVTSVTGKASDPKTYNLLVFTNIPHHYGSPGQPDPRKHTFAVMPPSVMYKPEHPACVPEMYNALKLYGRVPSRFPQ